MNETRVMPGRSRGLRAVMHRLDLRVDGQVDPRRRGGVVGAGAWTMVAVASNGLARLTTVVIVGRASGVESLGTFQTGLSLAQLLVLLLPTALGNAASKFVAQGRSAPSGGEPGAVYRFLRTRLLITVIALCAASFVLWMVIVGRGTSGAAQVVVLTAALCWYSVNRGLLFGLGLARRSAFWDITTSMATVLLVAGLWLVDGLTHGALLAVAATYVVFAAVNQPVGVSGDLPPARRTEIDRFCIAAVLGTLASAGFLQVTMLMSRVVGGAAAAGEFAAALNLATPASLLGASLSLVVFPELAGALARNDRARVHTLVDRAFRILLAMVLPGIVVTHYLAAPVVRLMLGEDFSDASSVLIVLMTAVLVTTAAVPCVTALTGGGQRGVQASAALSIAGLGAGVASWAVLVPALDVDGVAWGYLVGSLVTASGPTIWAWRTQRQRWTMPTVSTVVGMVLVVVPWRVLDLPIFAETATVLVVIAGAAGVHLTSYHRSERGRTTAEKTGERHGAP